MHIIRTTFDQPVSVEDGDLLQVVSGSVIVIREDGTVEQIGETTTSVIIDTGVNTTATHEDWYEFQTER